MKVFRSTLYPPSIDDPITVVAALSSLAEPVEQVMADMERIGEFVVSEVFEVPDDTQDPRLTVEGMKRQIANAADERNMAISYYWNAVKLGLLVEGGALFNPSPAPLSVDQIRTVLRQLHKHPSYNKQIITCISKDIRVVRLYPSGDINVIL